MQSSSIVEVWISLPHPLNSLKRRKNRLASIFFILLLVNSAGLCRAQSPAFPQISTEERLQKSGWWPTKGTLSRDAFAGSATCAKCHSRFAKTQAQHNMAHTLMRAPDSEVVRAAAGTGFRLGQYEYRIWRDATGDFSFSVSDGVHSTSNKLLWAFGSGAVGQSLLFERDGALYETRFSLFPPAKVVDTTPNQRARDAHTVEQAAGRRLSEVESQRCFSCHSTATVTDGRLDLHQAIPGITCEGCHGPGVSHVVSAAFSSEQGSDLIFNPGRLSPADSVDFCGACHGTSWGVVLSGETGVENVRFQAYRLQKSACWGNGDRRLVCASCHDPHQPLSHESESYDANCLACHVTAGNKPSADHPGPACKAGTSDCVKCHMQKYELRVMHNKFTDHFIRIVKDPAVFPDNLPNIGLPAPKGETGAMRNQP